jgi:serine/threonine protein kinase
VDELEEWSPAGGMLLDGDDSAVEDDEWDDGSDSTPKEVLQPGMVFGEGLEFQGEVIVPAVGKNGNGDGDLPLRRGGSEAGQPRREISQSGRERIIDTEKKRYEVVRQLGSGSYAVVYLVREKGGRRREYGESYTLEVLTLALKCLSKQDLEEEQIETQLFEAHIHLSLPIHQNIVTLHQTLQTPKWLFLMLELCPGEDLFYWLEKSRDASPPPSHARLPNGSALMSSSKYSASSIPFSSSQLFGFGGLHGMSSSFAGSHPRHSFQPGQSPASLLFSHHNGSGSHAVLNGNGTPYANSFVSQTPPTPSLLSAFSANTLLSPRRLRLIASMFTQMCEAVAICHDAGVSHRDIKPENFICCDSVELETVQETDGRDDGFGPQAKRKVVVKLTDFGLATAEEESGDVECGSKPYMSYGMSQYLRNRLGTTRLTRPECRNNLGPTYLPAPADVWSLGIVLINMLFHRNPWKDPTEGDSNFDSFLDDPTSFLLTKFTGIGREVARYLADKVLCIDVEERVSAAEFGRWIRGLPEMIAGRKAIQAIKVERKEREREGREHKWSAKEDKDDLFVKSPVVGNEAVRKPSASVLTVTAPPVPAFPIDIQDGSKPTLVASAPPAPITMAPLLSSLPPPGSARLDEPSTLPTPDLSGDDLRSASTVEENATPIDTHANPSPEVSEAGQHGSQVDGDEADARSLSTHRRRKRGVRKGKAAQAALAAASTGDRPSKEERDALLVELAAASQTLARDLSNVRGVDVNREEDFPPLGTSPAQIAAAKKSKWKDLLKASSQANPELAALARRVAERDAGSGGNWSAPAKLQGHPESKKSPFRPAFTTSASSGFTTAVSSYDQGTSATSSMSAVEDDMEWRRRPTKLATHIEEPDVQAKQDEERDRHRRHRDKEKRRDESPGRARKAALAAAAIAGGMGPMGTFGAGPGVKGHDRAPVPVHRSSKLSHGSVSKESQGIPIAPIAHVPLKAPAQTMSQSQQTVQAQPTKIMGFDRPSRPTAPTMSATSHHSTPSVPTLSFSQTTTMDGTTSRMSFASTDSNGTMRPQPAVYGQEDRHHEVQQVSESPNKPKIKGQIQSLAKMLSGLKTKH